MPNKVSVEYEDTINLPINKVYDLSYQWLEGQHKAKIGRKSNPPFLIIAKQGTIMTNSGFDPNWKKALRINFFDIEGQKTLVRLQATILSRNIRTKHIEKLKQAWWNGLFSSLFSLLVQMEGGTKKDTPTPTPIAIMPAQATTSKARFCPNCGQKLEESITICPSCGVEVE